MNPEPASRAPTPWTFRPRVAPTVFAVLGFAFLCSLGAWQLRRREEARNARAFGEARLAESAFDADAAPSDPDWRRASVTGVPDWKRRMVLPSRTMWLQQGQQWIVPVRTGAGHDVLVNVGWVPDDEAAVVLAREVALEGARTYTGLARVVEEIPDAPADPVTGGHVVRWKQVAPKQMAEMLGGDVLPWVLVDGEGIAADAPIPDRAPPVGGWRTTLPERPHGEYALTWFSLAFTLLGVWGSVSVRREETSSPT